MVTEWLRRWGLMDMNYTVHDLEVMGSDTGRVKPLELFGRTWTKNVFHGTTMGIPADRRFLAWESLMAQWLQQTSQ